VDLNSYVAATFLGFEELVARGWVNDRQQVTGISSSGSSSPIGGTPHSHASVSSGVKTWEDPWSRLASACSLGAR
jgi:hypothetical protein